MKQNDGASSCLKPRLVGERPGGARLAPALCVAALFTAAQGLGCGAATAIQPDIEPSVPDGGGTPVEPLVPVEGGASASPAEGGAGSVGDASAPPDSSTAEAGGGYTGLHVVMGAGGAPGHIVDGSGAVVQLHGADRSGTEYSCLNGGFFDGPADQAGIDSIKTWQINAIRVPLNADCWLGINGVPPASSGANYQSAISTWVNLITSNGLVAIVDLHWTAPGTYLANAQTPMADADHAPMFWSQVAATFASNGSVIFDLFNEPYIMDWGCWLDGVSTTAAPCAEWNGTMAAGSSYAVAGMASLLQAVRNAGAKNVVILGGLAYSNNMSEWVTSVNAIPMLPAPLDGISIENVAASWHIYDFNSEQSGCPSQYNMYSGTCNSAAMTATSSFATDVLSAGFPVLIGESGISAYSQTTAALFTAAQATDLKTWYDGILTWMDGQQQSYLAWSWNTDTPPVLISDYTGTPSPYFGTTYQAHLATTFP
jgi:hypothetical protein